MSKYLKKMTHSFVSKKGFCFRSEISAKSRIKGVFDLLRELMRIIMKEKE